MKQNTQDTQTPQCVLTLKGLFTGICLSLWDRKLKYRTVWFIISCLAMLSDLPKVPRRKAGWGRAFNTRP